MAGYEKIILATDLSDEGEQVAQRASEMAALNNATLHIAHVIEPLSIAYGGDIPLDFSDVQEQLQEQVQQRLQDFAGRFQVDSSCTHLLVGRTDNQIHELADEIGAGLIIVGSHGRHGLALLLGSTATGVLHGANCDVLAVRVGER